MRDLPGVPEEYTKSQRTPHGDKIASRHDRQRETEALFQDTDEQFAQIENRFGQEGLELLKKAIEARLARRETQTVIQESRQLFDYERTKNAVYSELLEGGAIKEIAPGKIIVDPERLRIFGLKTSWKDQKSGLTQMKAKYFALRDCQGITEEESQTGGQDWRPVFYTPEDEKSAFDPGEIKQARFVMTMWDAARHVRYGLDNQPTRKGADVSLEEAELATKLYHLQYGDAYRDEETGRLMIRGAKVREYKPVTQKLIYEDYRFRGSGEKDGVGLHLDIGKYLRLKAPEVLRNDLLRETDFRSPASGELRSEREFSRVVADNGSVVINNVWHILSRRLAGHRVTQLAPGLGGVLEKDQNGDEQLAYTFRVYTKDELPDRGRTKQPIAKAELVQLTQFDQSTFFVKRSDESDEQYRERTEPAANYQMVSNLASKVYRETGTRLGDFSFQEQVYLATYAQKTENRRGELVNFIAKFGTEGVRTFLSVEYGSEMGEQILDIGQKLPEKTARDIFREYNILVVDVQELSKTVGDNVYFREKLVEKNLTGLFEEQMPEAILRRAKDMLFTAAAIAREGRAEADYFQRQPLVCEDPAEVIKAMRTYRETVEKVNSFIVPSEDGEYDFTLLGHDANPPLKIFEFKVKSKQARLESYMTLQLRREGAASGAHLREFEYDGEARVNFLFSNSPIDRKISQSSRADALSLRIDREGKKREGGEIVSNDPTLPDGEVSLEVGSNAHGDPTLPGAVVGRVVSIGNELSVAQRSASDHFPQYLHNRESFSRNFGEAGVFADAVDIIENEVKSRYVHRETKDSRFAAVLGDVLERYPGLEVPIQKSLEAPQLGEFHNEGPEVKAHLSLMLQTLEDIKNGKFHEAVQKNQGLKKILEDVVLVQGHINPDAVDYVFLHDISKPDTLSLVVEGQKSAVEVTWEEWQNIGKAGRPYKFNGQPVQSIFYNHASEGRLGQHGAKGAELLKGQGVAPDVLAAIAMHDDAYRFDHQPSTAVYKEVFVDSGLSEKQAKFLLAMTYIDSVSCQRPGGKVDLRNFENLLRSRDQFEKAHLSGHL